MTGHHETEFWIEVRRRMVSVGALLGVAVVVARPQPSDLIPALVILPLVSLIITLSKR